MDFIGLQRLLSAGLEDPWCLAACPRENGAGDWRLRQSGSGIESSFLTRFGFANPSDEKTKQRHVYSLTSFDWQAFGVQSESLNLPLKQRDSL